MQRREFLLTSAALTAGAVARQPGHGGFRSVTGKRLANV